MRTRQIIGLMMGLCLALACASKSGRFDTGAHYDTTADYSGYDTFAFKPMRAKAAGSQNGKRLRDAIQRDLVSMGYREVPEADADFLVSYDLGVYAKAKVSGRNTFSGNEGRITVTLSDARSGATLWYGWAEAQVRPGQEDADKVIGQAVDELFGRFLRNEDGRSSG